MRSLPILFLAPLLTLAVQAQSPATLGMAEKGSAEAWSHLRVAVGNVTDFKKADRPGWRNNGTSFTAKRSGAGKVPILVAFNAKGGITYEDYTWKVTVAPTGGKPLLQESGRISKNGGGKTFSCTWDPALSQGTLNVSIQVTGGNPEAFTYFVSGSIDAPAQPRTARPEDPARLQKEAEEARRLMDMLSNLQKNMRDAQQSAIRNLR